jgi:hypothetical protein
MLFKICGVAALIFILAGTIFFSIAAYYTPM